MTHHGSTKVLVSRVVDATAKVLDGPVKVGPTTPPAARAGADLEKWPVAAAVDGRFLGSPAIRAGGKWPLTGSDLDQGKWPLTQSDLRHNQWVLN